MSDDDRYTCPRCNDSMNLRFLRSHELICAWVAARERQAVERLLREVQN